MRPSDLKSLKVLLGAIRAGLASAREALNKCAASVTNQQIEQQEANQVEWEKTQEVLARPRRTDPNEQAANEANQERRHWQNFGLQGLLTLGSWLAFAAAAIYAGIAYHQLGVMHKAASNAEDAMKIDQRAWVMVSNIKPEGGNVVVSFGNSGKTPARNFSVHITGEPVAKTKEPILGAEDLLPGVGIIAPNGFFHVPLDASGYYDPKSNRLAIHGRVDYADIFGSSHWTTFCYYLSATGVRQGFAPCEKGNETDDQPTK